MEEADDVTSEMRFSLPVLALMLRAAGVDEGNQHRGQGEAGDEEDGKTTGGAGHVYGHGLCDEVVIYRSLIDGCSRGG